jgi:hypothetical protein
MKMQTGLYYWCQFVSHLGKTKRDFHIYPYCFSEAANGLMSWYRETINSKSLSTGPYSSIMGATIIKRVSQYEWATGSPWARYSFCPLSRRGQRRTHSLYGCGEIFAGTGSPRCRPACESRALAMVGRRLRRLRRDLEGLAG